jgi:hypothetical protein
MYIKIKLEKYAMTSNVYNPIISIISYNHVLLDSIYLIMTNYNVNGYIFIVTFISFFIESIELLFCFM